jgi:transposase-like protein
MARKIQRVKTELAQTETVDSLPLACVDETAARKLIEQDRWGGTPYCPHCGDTDVYAMKGASAEERGLYRCHGCKKQFTVRVGSIFEDSKIPLRQWVRAMWEATSCKNGISALELSRKLQITYRSALFMMHRIRHAMAPTNPPKLEGTIEADETFVGGKPRNPGPRSGPGCLRGSGTRKAPVAAILQRGGAVMARVIPKVNSENVKSFIRENVDSSARIMTDQEASYKGIGAEFEGGHHTVNHGRREYVRGDVTTNGVEGFFARVKRGLNGTYHAVSREHLHRYIHQFAFAHNTRRLNDGERFSALVRDTSGKRLLYRKPRGEVA